MITQAGDSRFMIGEQVEWWKFEEERDRLMAEGKRPAVAEPLLLGVTKASLSTESFMVAGRVDELAGLKENVIMGRLISAGTGVAGNQ